jgi:hypothetical protein
MKADEIHSFDDLKRYLTSFTTWDGDVVHDFGRAFVLLGAILDNIRICSTDADWELIGGYLTDEQREFLKLLAEHASHSDVG